MMYDKVKLYVDRGIVGDSFSAIPGYLDPTTVKSVYDYHTGQERITGNLDGLRLSVNVGGVYIEGSFAKFFYGDNLHTHTRATTEEVIQKLSDLLHADISEARVMSLEFGTNFPMRYEVVRYLSLLGNLNHMQQSNFAGSIYYTPKGKESYQRICFYDKGAEATGKGVVLPAGLGDNLLRYEIRLNGRLNRQLKCGQVYGSTLYDEAFYKQVGGMWRSRYFSIEKKRQIKNDVMNKKMTVGEAFNLLMAQLIGQGDGRVVETFINDLKANKALSHPKDYTALKKKIREACSSIKTTETDELIKELDDDIKSAGAYL